MKNKSGAMTKLNNKLRILKNSELFKVKEMNSTAARVTDKTQKEDYVLILNMRNNKMDSIAISIDYKDRKDEDVLITVSKAKAVYDPENGFYGSYRSENIVRSESMSLNDFSEKLRLFNRILPELTAKDFIDSLCSTMDLSFPEQVKASRPRMR